MLTGAGTGHCALPRSGHHALQLSLWNSWKVNGWHLRNKCQWTGQKLEEQCLQVPEKWTPEINPSHAAAGGRKPTQIQNSFSFFILFY